MKGNTPEMRRKVDGVMDGGGFRFFSILKQLDRKAQAIVGFQAK
jgi:hypothetical protein